MSKISIEAVEEAARALVREQTSGTCEYGKVCRSCDCLGFADARDAYARDQARAVLTAALPHLAHAAEVARMAAEKAWWEGVNDQWKHRPIGVRLNEFDNPYRPSMGGEPRG